MKSILDPCIPYWLAKKINKKIKYTWPVEYMIKENGDLIAEDIVTDSRTENLLPCPSIDMAVRFLFDRLGIIIEPRFDLKGFWIVRVIRSGQATEYGPHFQLRDAAIIFGIDKALEYETDRN
jgi:hypothetical protein